MTAITPSTSWLDALAARESALYIDHDTAILHADALDVLEDLPARSVDLIVADPPYSSGGAFRSDRTQPTSAKYVNSDSSRQQIPDFAGDNRDQRSYFAWSTLWLTRAYRALKPGRVCGVFTDWRQLPTTTDALQAAGFVWRGVAVWDKIAGRTSPGITNGHVEYFAWGTRGPIDLGHEVYLPTVIRASIPREDRDLHQTPKPIELLARIATLAPPGGLVVDPFTGSGSVPVACKRVGRRSIGVELDDIHAQTAARRLALESSQLSLLEP